MPSKWALTAVIYYIKIDNKTKIERPNFRNARNMCRWIESLGLALPGLAWYGLSWVRVRFRIRIRVWYQTGSNSAKELSLGFGFFFGFRFGSLCGPCVCVSVCCRVSSDFAVLYRVIVVSFSFRCCYCCLLLNLNFEWCARKTDGYFLKMRMNWRRHMKLYSL